MDCTTPGFPVHQQLLELAQTHVRWVGDAIQPSHPLSSPSIFPSITVFSKESVLHVRWPKYWSFSCSISPSNDYSGLTSFRMNWLYLLAVQGTLKSFLQCHSSKASILWCSAFFIVQLSHAHVTTRKTIALVIWTFIGKVMSLLFNMLSRLVITFLPRSKHLLISWLQQSPSAAILEPSKIKSATCFHCFPDGVQPQQDPGIPSGWTASANKRMTRGDQALVSEAHNFIFKRSFYTLTCT